MKRSTGVWVAKNRNGFICLFGEQPTRDTKQGKWKSKFPFCNSIAYSELVTVFENAPYTWENDPEYFEINYEA